MVAFNELFVIQAKGTEACFGVGGAVRPLFALQKRVGDRLAIGGRI